MRYFLPFGCRIVGFLYVLLLFLFPVEGFSLHVAGSDVYYRYDRKLPDGRDRYNVTFIYYYDCESGGPRKAPIDEQIRIYVYNNDNSQRLSSQVVDRKAGEPRKLEWERITRCATVQHTNCVQEIFFNFNVDVPQNETGFTVAWQTCCRNPNILNIKDYSITGSTIACTLPGKTNGVTNNSAIFNKEPLGLVCAGFDLEYDMGAFDPDGDSLTYQFVPPFNARDKNNNGPGAATDINSVVGPPPYGRLLYTAGHTFQQPFGQGSTTEIDPQTGLWKIKANNPGLYVIGISVKEYRNGVLISEQIRDFQVYVSAVCRLNQTPVDVQVSSDNFQSVSSDRYYIKPDTTFCINWLISNLSDLTIRFKIELEGFLKDTSDSKVTISGDNPMTITYCSKKSCSDLISSDFGGIKATPIDECAIKNNKSKSIFIQLLPRDSLMPRMRIDAIGMRQDKDTFFLNASAKNCFEVKYWNEARDKDLNIYELVPSFPLNAPFWTYNKVIRGDTTVFQICITTECTFPPDQFLQANIRVKDHCDKWYDLSMKRFMKLDPPIFEPIRLELLTVPGMTVSGDTVILRKKGEGCVFAQLKTDRRSFSLKMNYKMERLDVGGNSLNFVTVATTDSSLTQITKSICSADLCQNRGALIRVIVTGKDSVTCEFTRTAVDTFYFKNGNNPLSPVKIELNPLDFKQSNDTLYMNIGKDFCAEFTVDDRKNFGDLTYEFDSPLLTRSDEPATAAPLTGKVNLTARFCWKADCDELDKVYPLTVKVRSVNACNETVTDEIKLFIKIRNEVNQPLRVKWDFPAFDLTKLDAGRTYCFTAEVTDPDSVAEVKYELKSPFLEPGFDFGEAATVKVTGSDFRKRIEVCYTPNCHSSLKTLALSLCGTEQTLCDGPKTGCDSLKMSVKDCFTGFPNVFTPNGDGVNDFFRPTDVSNIERYEIQIYDRWGTLMYQGNDLTGWNGKMSGTGDNAAEGVYFYIANLSYFSGSRPISTERKASFTLLR